MQDSEDKPPSQPWKDLEDWRRQVKERAHRRYQKIEAWKKEQLKPRKLRSDRPPENIPQPPEKPEGCS